MAPLDAKGADNQTDRSTKRIPSAAQEPIICRGLHGQFGVHQRHDFKFTQCFFDEFRLRVVAHALQNFAEDEIPNQQFIPRNQRAQMRYRPCHSVS